ncbi:heavy metal translocating P-type ATPase [Piscibacillus halophilus]|uniref:heavy metal translocating P-type ATPase n=1 Tax=Piscibacillus halophilus TaxID=571933 RepID=UPI003CCE1E4B
MREDIMELSKYNQATDPHFLSHKIKEHLELIFSIISGLLILFAYISEINQVENIFIAILYISAYVIGGYYKAKEGIEDLLYDKSLNVEILMIIAAVGAASIGYWHEGAILIFIFSLSGALETYSLQKSEKNLSKLVELAPEEANLLTNDDSIVPVRVSQLKIGDRILIRNGERVPADGEVISGVTSIDESTITGESMPVSKQAGDGVFNGTINGSGSVVVKVTKRNEDSLFQKMIQLVEEAKGNRPPSQQLIDKIEGPYVITVLAVVALMLIIPPFAINWSFDQTFYRAMVLLVVASPCAVVASIMPAILSAISTGARNGVLMKGGTYLEQLSKVKAMAFDKTGTITKGQPEVTDYETIEDQQDVLEALVSIEKQSSHPLAKAVVAFGESQKLTGKIHIESIEDVPGEGVKAYSPQNTFLVGNERLIQDIEHDSDILQNKRKELQNEGKTVVYVAKNDRLIAVLGIKDQIRPETKALIQFLNKQGIKTIMITGDHENTATSISQEAGLTEWISECLPEEKVSQVERLKEIYGSVAMVGDGVNDAPAMAKADIGIAMGNGTDVAIETSDLVLMNSEIEKIKQSYKLSSRLNRIIKQNLVFSIAVIILLIMANFSQNLSLPLGVIGHEGSTILVILNGLRLLRG